MKEHALEELQATNALLMERVGRLEEKVFGEQKAKPITLYQQILLLHYLGVLDQLWKLQISNVKKAELIALLIGRDMSSVKKAVESLKKGGENDVKSARNIQYAYNILKGAKLEDMAADAFDDLIVD